MVNELRELVIVAGLALFCTVGLFWAAHEFSLKAVKDFWNWPAAAIVFFMFVGIVWAARAKGGGG